jgi:hypothetical protein
VHASDAVYSAMCSHCHFDLALPLPLDLDKGRLLSHDGHWVCTCELVLHWLWKLVTVLAASSHACFLFICSSNRFARRFVVA